MVIAAFSLYRRCRCQHFKWSAGTRNVPLFYRRTTPGKNKIRRPDPPRFPGVTAHIPPPIAFDYKKCERGPRLGEPGAPTSSLSNERHHGNLRCKGHVAGLVWSILQRELRRPGERNLAPRAPTYTAHLVLSRPSRLTVSATSNHHHQRGTSLKGRRGSSSLAASSPSPDPRTAAQPPHAMWYPPQPSRGAARATVAALHWQRGPSAPFVRTLHEEPLPQRLGPFQPLREGDARDFSAQRRRYPQRSWRCERVARCTECTSISPGSNTARAKARASASSKALREKISMLIMR